MRAAKGGYIWQTRTNCSERSARLKKGKEEKIKLEKMQFILISNEDACPVIIIHTPSITKRLRCYIHL